MSAGRTGSDGCRCGECGEKAHLVSGEKIYPRRPDLWEKSFFRCDCGAYVGTHPGTTNPLGKPTNSETRSARSQAHAHFDPLYKEVGRRKPDGGSPRKRGYRWLAEQMGMSIDVCHIGMMTRAEADRVVEICRPHLEKMGIEPENR